MERHVVKLVGACSCSFESDEPLDVDNLLSKSTFDNAVYPALV